MVFFLFQCYNNYLSAPLPPNGVWSSILEPGLCESIKDGKDTRRAHREVIKDNFMCWDPPKPATKMWAEKVKGIFIYLCFGLFQSNFSRVRGTLIPHCSSASPVKKKGYFQQKRGNNIFTWDYKVFLKFIVNLRLWRGEPRGKPVTLCPSWSIKFSKNSILLSNAK